MATKPINRYTVQESNNLKVHENYSSEQITCIDDDTAVEGTNWATGGDGPAKSITIVPYTGDAANVIKIRLKINGSYGDYIQLLFDDFPVTINKLLIDQVEMQTSDGSTDEIFTIISYH
jgi:hypothetical protein